MAARTTWPGDVAFGEEATSASIRRLPGGMVAYVSTDATTTGVTTEQDLDDLDVTFSLAANRLVVIEGYCARVSSETADDCARLIIELDGSDVQEARIDCGHVPTPANTGAVGHVRTEPLALASGSHTVKLRGALAEGTGPLAYRSGSAFPAWVSIIDVGPVF